MNLDRAHRTAGILLLLLAAGMAYGALQLTYFTSIGPGPGFFPFWLSVILGGLALAMVAKTFMASPASEAEPDVTMPDRAGYVRMAVVVVALAATAGLLEWLGFRLTMVAMYLLLLGSLGRHGKVAIALITAAGSFGAYEVFVHWLHVPLPIGVFGL